MGSKFGTIIKEARLSKDMSLRDLSTASGVDYSYIGRLEKGESNPSRKTVVKLSKALDILQNELMIAAGYVPDFEDDSFDAHTQAAHIAEGPAVTEEVLDQIEELLRKAREEYKKEKGK